MNTEFKTGDIVHFQPYIERKPLPAKVKAVTFGRFGVRKRLQYHLGGAHVLSITSPRSIVESKFFKPITEKW
jgi:hypothetical protein